jgi:hypothetical protein
MYTVVGVTIRLHYNYITYIYIPLDTCHCHASLLLLACLSIAQPRTVRSAMSALSSGQISCCHSSAQMHSWLHAAPASAAALETGRTLVLMPEYFVAYLFGCLHTVSVSWLRELTEVIF